MAHYLDFELTVPGRRGAARRGHHLGRRRADAPARGLLRAMYTELHHRFADAGYPLAALTATEGGIYGRFGYGPATIETE